MDDVRHQNILLSVFAFDWLLTLVSKLIEAVRDLVVPFVKAADDAAPERETGNLAHNITGTSHNVLVDYQKPREVVERMKLSLPNQGQGKEGLLDAIQKVLQHSVNTWDQGFLDKLYASPTAVCNLSPATAARMLTETGWCCVRYRALGSQHKCKTPDSEGGDFD